MSIPHDKNVGTDSIYVFHGFKSSPLRRERFFARLLDWFAAIGEVPEKMGVSAPGFGEKIMNFKRTRSRLQDSGFANVTSFDLFSMQAGGVAALNHWQAYGSIRIDSQEIDFGIDFTIGDLDHPALLDLARDTADLFQPIYGYAYQMSRKLGSNFYASGLSTLDPWGETEEEARNISRWGRVGKRREVYRRGVLRDVYRMNFLTDAQLKNDIGGQTLEEWIIAGGRGELADYAGGMRIWKVPEESISDCRAELTERKVVFCYRDYEIL